MNLTQLECNTLIGNDIHHQFCWKTFISFDCIFCLFIRKL